MHKFIIKVWLSNVGKGGSQISELVAPFHRKRWLSIIGKGALLHRNTQASCGEKEAGGGEHDNVYGCQDTFI